MSLRCWSRALGLVLLVIAIVVLAILLVPFYPLLEDVRRPRAAAGRRRVHVR